MSVIFEPPQLWAADDVVETKKQLLTHFEQTLETTRDLAASGLLKKSKYFYSDELKTNISEGVILKRLSSVISDIKYGTSLKSKMLSGIPLVLYNYISMLHNSHILGHLISY